MGFPFATRMMVGGGVPTSFLTMFGSGEDGILFDDPSDKTLMFLLADGSTGNVVNTNDPVGLWLDKHSWAGASLATILAAQSELLVAASWAMSVAGGTSTATNSPSGTLNLTGDGTNAAIGDQSFTTVVGKTYKLGFTVATSAGILSVGTAQGGTQNINALTPGVGAGQAFFVATATTTWVRFSKSAAAACVVSGISCKLVPGNHAIQTTTANRPLWIANSGKPYLQMDGVSDGLLSPFIPTAALGVFAGGQYTGASQVMIGGGNSTAGKRGGLGNDASGKAGISWGTQSATATGSGSDIRNVNHTFIGTGDAVTRDLWLDGVNLFASAPSGGPDGTGGGEALGYFNNNGSPVSGMSGRIYAAGAIARRITPAEIAMVHTNFNARF